MGSRTLGLRTVGQGGIAPRTTSPTHHVLTSSSAQYLSPSFALVCPWAWPMAQYSHLGPSSLHIHIYIIETSETLIIFHVRTIFKFI